jgi:hypothetical protein
VPAFTRQARAITTGSPSTVSSASSSSSHSRPHRHLADRNGAQDLEGGAREHEAVARLAALDRPADQRRRRPGVLEGRVPRAAGVLGRAEAAVAERLVEAHLTAPISRRAAISSAP